MRGSTIFEEITLATDKLINLTRRSKRGDTGLADARLEERFLYLPFAPKDYRQRTEELDDLFQAVADLRPLRCKYKHRDGVSERLTLHPYALVLYRDAIYCVGEHVEKKEIHTFVLDRMRDTDLQSSERFELPRDFHVDDYFQGQFGIWRGKNPTRVVIEFEQQVADLVTSRRMHSTQKISHVGNGNIRLSMTVGNLTEVVSWVLGFGRTAKVLRPPELAELVRKELLDAIALYEKPSEEPPMETSEPEDEL